MSAVICVFGWSPEIADAPPKPDELIYGRVYEPVGEMNEHYFINQNKSYGLSFPKNLFVETHPEPIEVELLAFDKHQERKIRKVYIPANQPITLESVFQFGQNDFQPAPGFYSVSVGDVIRWQGKKVVVLGCGFGVMTEEQYKEYTSTDNHLDLRWVYVREKEFEQIH